MIREHRAQVGRRRLEDAYDQKIRAFLDFVPDHFVETGVKSLDRSVLPDYSKLKFGTLREGYAALGGEEKVISTYVEFQKHLYAPSN